MKNKKQLLIVVSISMLFPILVLILSIIEGFRIWGGLLALMIVFAILPIFAYFLYTQVIEKEYLVTKKETTGESSLISGRKKRNVLFMVAGTSVLTGILALATIFFFIGSGSITVTMDESRLYIDAPMVNQTVSYDDFASVEIRYELDAGTRMDGFGGTDISSGNYRNDEFGTYILAIHNDIQTYVIVIDNRDNVLVLNQDSTDRTIEMFNELKSKTCL